MLSKYSLWDGCFCSTAWTLNVHYFYNFLYTILIQLNEVNALMAKPEVRFFVIQDCHSWLFHSTEYQSQKDMNSKFFFFALCFRIPEYNESLGQNTVSWPRFNGLKAGEDLYLVSG